MFYFNESTVAIADAIFNNAGSATNVGQITDNIGFNTIEAFERRLQSSFKGRMRESAVGRTMISGYEALEAGAAKLENLVENSLGSYSNFLRNTTASLASTEANEEFAKKHGWIAKAMGVKSTLKERAERSETSAEVNLRLEKNLSDLKYNVYDNLKDAQNYAYGKIEAAGNFISSIPNKAKGLYEYTGGKFQNAMKYANNSLSKSETPFDPKTGNTYQSNQSIYDPNSTGGSGELFQPRVVHMDNSYKSGRALAGSNNANGTIERSENYQPGSLSYNNTQDSKPQQTADGGKEPKSFSDSILSLREKLRQVNYRNLIIDGMIGVLAEEEGDDRARIANEKRRKQKIEDEKAKYRGEQTSAQKQRNELENWRSERSQANERFALERQKIKDDDSIVDKKAAIKDLRAQRDKELGDIREKYDPYKDLKANLAKSKELVLQEKDLNEREKEVREKIKNQYDPKKSLDENLAKRKEVSLEKEKFDEDKKKFLLEKKKLKLERQKIHKDY